MANGINRVTLGGNLGADPELRITQGGTTLLKFRIATNEAHYDKDKNLVERTDWHDIVVFGNRAEALMKILGKGDGVVVDGSLRTYLQDRDGQPVKRVEVVARDVMLTGRRKASGPALPAIDEPDVFAPIEPEAETVEETRPMRGRGKSAPAPQEATA